MKTKLVLTVLGMSILLAGCSSESSDGQFSGHSKGITVAVNRSKKEAKSQSERNNNMLRTADYQKIDSATIQNALNKDQIASAKAQIANKKLIINGAVKTIGKVKDNQKSMVITSKDQTYLVYGKPVVFNKIKLGDHVKIYGNGLALMNSKASEFGISSENINSKTLLFDANQINK